MTHHSFTIDQRSDRDVVEGFNTAGARGTAELVRDIGHRWAHLHPVGSWGAYVGFPIAGFSDDHTFLQERFATRDEAVHWLARVLGGLGS